MKITTAIEFLRAKSNKKKNSRNGRFKRIINTIFKRNVKRK